MSVPISELRRLYARSGNRCAFTNCRRLLVVPGPPGEAPVLLGDVAHIIGASPAGPRGESILTPAERNKYDNLILLCNIHHQLVDAQESTYSPERLRAMKQDHEAWVDQRLSVGDVEPPASAPWRNDELFSTLMPVARMPRYVFSAPAKFKTEQETRLQLGAFRGREVTPFIIRGDRVYAFQDFRLRGNPFQPVVKPRVEQHRVVDWIEDPDNDAWFRDLLNRSLNKLTGRLGLSFDRDHKRYYFPMNEAGEPRAVTYRPLNAKQATRQVVWQPRRKATGEPKPHWLHLAVSLRFIRTEPQSWALSLRPELRVTVDGTKPYESARIGSRVTRKKARLFNYDLLGDVQFWRDFLSNSSARIVLPFGPKTDRLVILTDLMAGEVNWPGIPSEHAKPFRNVSYVDDLMSWGEAEVDDETDAEVLDWEEADSGDIG